MKKSMYVALGLLLLSIHPSTVCTILVPGNSVAALASINPIAAPFLSFPQRITTKIFDPASGNLFLGLSVDGLMPDGSITTPPSGDNTYAPPGTYLLSRVFRPISGSIPQVIGIATNASVFAPPTTIDYLALAASTGDLKPNLAFVTRNTDNTMTFSTNYINVSSADGTIAQYSESLLGINPINGANGTIIGGIIQIAANRHFVFAGIKPMIGSTITPFGSLGSGIAVVAIDQAPLVFLPALMSVPSLLLQQTAAVPGDPGIKSVEFDPTTPQIFIQQGSSPIIVSDRLAMLWDDPLKRLYLGIQLSTAPVGGGAPGDGARAVVVGHLDPDEDGELTLEDIAPNSAFSSANHHNIVGDEQATTGAPVSLAIAHIQVMHCSTGPSYLIVNGGNGTYSTDSTMPNGTTGNTIYALPLVDVGNPTNVTQGTLANKNMFNNITKRFEVAAVNNPDLPDSSTDSFAFVGAGPLPLQAATPISGTGGGIADPNTGVVPNIDTIDMIVVGDTVYVAIATDQSDADETGVLYSQALFDETGKIINWTPWTKRGFPFASFPEAFRPTGSARFVQVDPVIGKVWAVDGETTQKLRITNWASGVFLSELPRAVNNALSDGSFSVLDLDQATRGFLNTAVIPNIYVTLDRYALFGGINKVAFAITTRARTDAQNAPQVSIENFSNDRTFLVTKLPNNSGCVTTLEYSRRLTGDTTNYFFAGSEQGLFVFANDTTGAGFDVATLSTFDQPPFSTGSWQKITAIPGSVIDIKTSGKTLYVLTTQAVPFSSSTQSTLYGIDFAPNIATMFSPPFINILAQSSVSAPGSDLSGTLSFYGIQIISTAPDFSTEQLVIATNNGIYQSNATTAGGIATATDQQMALWTLITPDTATVYSGIEGIDTPIPSTVWPFSIDDPLNNGVFNRSSIHQLNGGTTNPFAFTPVFFNASSDTRAFNSFDPITYFWSDGARRFFIVRRNMNSNGTVNQLLITPFDIHQYNVHSPTIINDGVLAGVTKFNWIKEIGATGLILAGTNQGVVALE